MKFKKKRENCRLFFRAAHNELEKNRRANLRGHLEALKEVLPAETDSQQRDTTLSLLTRARNHIRVRTWDWIFSCPRLEKFFLATFTFSTKMNYTVYKNSDLCF